MRRLGSHAARRLRAAVAAAPRDSSEAALQMRAACFLAVAYARLGLVHEELLQQIALTATQLLRRRLFQPRRRRQALRLALLAASFAALALHPPQLFQAIGELLKQQRQVLKLLGPTESMLLLWAFGRVGHSDPPAQLLLTQRATTQVGQLDCKGLSHAYMQCATAGLSAPPLLAALRKATRQRLPAMVPGDVAVLVVALAALGQQDQLLLDDVAKALHNKMAHLSGPQISSSIVSCSLLRYRNPWLLDQAAKMLAAAARLVQLASSDTAQHPQQADVPQLIAAAYHLAIMPPGGGTAGERALAGDAVANVAAAALQQQFCCSCLDWLMWLAEQQAGQQQQAGAAALEDVHHQQQQQQQQGVGLVTATIGTVQQLRKGLVQFDPEVLARLREWQQQGVPVAVFADDEGPAGLQQRWVTTSQPQQLLPLAQQWEQGLAQAGWGVLLLKQRFVEVEAVS
ncbi:hypothetical protein COO60DRAFT_1642574 [Scenedesmus sp. NREL 46B-D3]|nr:hypothetical protein COO60DRAFT_1642574 [Scenedesmus sp. NREL 46B-D3]